MKTTGGRRAGEAGADRARSSGSQLHLPSSHQSRRRTLAVLGGFRPAASEVIFKSGWISTPAFVLILLKPEGRRVPFSSFFFVPPVSPDGAERG